MKCLRPQRDTSDHDESVSRPADDTLKGSAIISVLDDKISSIEDGEQAPSPAEPTSENTNAAAKAPVDTVKPVEEANIASAPSSEAAHAKDGLHRIPLPDVSAHSLSEMDESIASDAEASSEAAGDEYEQRDIESLSSGDLDCTSTPVAIGQNPFARSSDAHEAGGPLRYAGPEAGSRCLAPSCAVILPLEGQPTALAGPACICALAQSARAVSGHDARCGKASGHAGAASDT